MRPPLVVALAAAVTATGAAWLLPGTHEPAGRVSTVHENALRFQQRAPERRPAMCFAPGTPAEIMRLFKDDADNNPAPRFEAADWWTRTATDGFTSQGEAITLRWSIVPDGTLIEGGVGEPDSGSNLRSWLDGRYGSINNWLPLFQQSFDAWGEVTGVTYVYEANDDGAAINGFGNDGVVGVRGDVRIGGHAIDGNSNTLAYNYFPNNGDMVLDTADSFFNTTTNNSRRLRNVVMHEHGHGLGLAHSCPVNRTKLMEPFIAENFEGPQRDDILGAQRNNGDPDEDNNSVGAATPLGVLGTRTTVRRNLSIDDNSDQDFFSFSAPAANTYSVEITLTPVGATYLAGPQNGDGECSAGTSYDSLRVHDLGLELRTATTPLATSNSGAEGVAETISGYQLSGAGPYYIRVFGDASNDVQAYEIAVTLDATVTGIFALSSSTYNVGEMDGSVTVTVERTGDTGAAESVDFATANGGAVAGIDYTATSGTLDFGPGQTSNTFAVPISNNQSFAGDRDFSISLSNATGNSAVGSPATATVTITEDDPPGTFVFENNDVSTVGTIPGAGDGTPLASSVYPMTIGVSGVAGTVLDVSVGLDGLSHDFPRDMDILLVGPTGQSVMLLSDAGGGNDESLDGAALTFEDDGAILPDRDTGLVPGAVYAPVNLDPVDDDLLAPAPSSPFGASLSAFAGLPPNGTWSLYFMDDWASVDAGSLGGFSLTFTTTQAATAPVEVRIESIALNGPTVSLQVYSAGNATFALQRSSGLEAWTTVESGLVPGPNPWTVTDDPPAAGDQYYYRLIEE